MPCVLEPIPTPPSAASDDPAGLLWNAAAAHKALLKAAAVSEDATAEALEEALDWTATEEAKHPRWPAGTPGGLGGKFMRVGQHFLFGGKEWQVSSIVEGKVIAHEATGKAAATKIFDPASTGGPAAELTGATRAKARVVKGGKGQESDVAVVSPYNEPSTHNPAIPIPPESKIKPEQWKRFGEAEQLHYTDLMKRYGKHSASGAASLITQAYQKYDGKIQDLVNSAYHGQYGSSSGFTLSLTSMFSSGPSQEQLEKLREQREQAMELQGLIRDAYAWDLYNRTKSPDVSLFHKDHGNGPSWWQQFIDTPKKIFSGLSQSHHFRKTFFGNNTIATPVSARHIVMATYVAGPLKGAGKSFTGEKEMAVPYQMALDKRSIAFSNTTVPGSKLTWLENTTATPQGGEHLELFIDAVQNGAHLPIPPPAPEINLGGNASVPPPTEALEALAEYADKLPKIGKDVTPEVLGKTGLPFAHTEDNGLPKAVTALDAGYKPGDFMMGLQGTLYWVGPNPTDTSGYGLMIHKLIPDGPGKLQASSETFVFDETHKNYKLLGNVPPPKPKDIDFDPEGWVFSNEKATAIQGFAVGDKFKVDGDAYEVVDTPTVSTTQIVHLESGAKGTINSDYQAVKLEPKEGWMPAKAKIAPAKGMSLAYNGKKHVVTSVKKDGTVSIKRSTGGKVIQLASDDPALEGLFDHGAWKQGSKAAIGDVEVGDYFHGGRGEVIRPHRVDAVEGSWVHWTNLDTGETGKSLQKKKVRTLIPADGGVGHDKKPTVEADATAIKTEAAAAGELEVGKKVKVSDIPVGHHGTLDGSTVKVLGTEGADEGTVKVELVDGNLKGMKTHVPNGGELTYLGASADPEIPADGVDPEAPWGYKVGSTVTMAKVTGGTWNAEVVGHGKSPTGKDVLKVKKGSKTFTVSLEKVVTKPEETDAAPEFKADPLDEVIEQLGDASDGGYFQPYKSSHGTGGKVKHDRIKEMPEGTVFQGKDGKKWKVQVAGSQPVISDGAKNFQVDGHLRGKALPDEVLPTPAPPTGGATPSANMITKEPPGALPTEELAQLAQGNPEGVAVSDLNPGEYWHDGIGWWMVQDDGLHMPLGVEPGSSFKQPKASTIPADLYLPSSAYPSAGGAADQPAPQPASTASLNEKGWINAVGVTTGELNPGDYWKDGNHWWRKLENGQHSLVDGDLTKSVNDGFEPMTIYQQRPEEPDGAPEVPDEVQTATDVTAATQAWGKIPTVDEATALVGPNTLGKYPSDVPVGTIMLWSGGPWIKLTEDKQMKLSTGKVHPLTGVPDLIAVPPQPPKGGETLADLDANDKLPNGMTVVTKTALGNVVLQNPDGTLHTGEDGAIKPYPDDTPLGDINPTPSVETPTPEPTVPMAVSELDSGDEFENAEGHPFAVVAHAQNGQATIVKDEVSGNIQQVSWEVGTVDVKPSPAQPTASPDYEAVDDTSPLSPEIEAAIEKGGTVDMDLEGYSSAWGSGGKYKHDWLTDLQPGQSFTAKGSKANYVYVKSLGGGYVLVWRPDMGQAFKVANVRVKAA